ncbi:MAG: hypothetical protein OHK005_20390 [Candidatus Methylacidiphilales bacterium]
MHPLPDFQRITDGDPSNLKIRSGPPRNERTILLQSTDHAASDHTTSHQTDSKRFHKFGKTRIKPKSWQTGKRGLGLFPKNTPVPYSKLDLSRQMPRFP